MKLLKSAVTENKKKESSEREPLCLQWLDQIKERRHAVSQQLQRIRDSIECLRQLKSSSITRLQGILIEVMSMEESFQWLESLSRSCKDADKSGSILPTKESVSPIKESKVLTEHNDDDPYHDVSVMTRSVSKPDSPGHHTTALTSLSLTTRLASPPTHPVTLEPTSLFPLVVVDSPNDPPRTETLIIPKVLPSYMEKQLAVHMIRVHSRRIIDRRRELIKALNDILAGMEILVTQYNREIVEHLAGLILKPNC